ncbi:hypothetical protein G6F68_010370 [Rhizopus microsporus]|nr:hypothetical protein G6F68_010370 [Rhizopus microsporus]
MATGQRGIEQRRAIRRQRNAIGSHGERLRGTIRVAQSHLLSFHDRYECRIRRCGHMADQALGRGAGSEVDHDDAAGAAQRRVGHVGHALATDTEIEAHIVDVGARVDDVDREHQRSGHGIGGQIDRHQLGAAGLWCREPGRGGVQHPQPTLAIGHHTLHADEVGRRIGTVLAVDARIRIGHGAAILPVSDTATLVGMAPSKRATGSMMPMLRSLGSTGVPASASASALGTG